LCAHACPPLPRGGDVVRQLLHLHTQNPDSSPL
jgi:hypothetical protein